ncbi:hypothetical protein PIROE2DRAFT_57220 [Piromyces sp. E2]|nr:hypothetical protein PIROE2DRAFT_57220 [Piromyces sp. E2]|eukprot:OUM69657.1 hypothetical protein PIROE2DRAFT_57220 [Piromyces sp. E2]
MNIIITQTCTLHIDINETNTNKNEKTLPITENLSKKNEEKENNEDEDINKSLETKWDVKHSSIAPNFIANYYENSSVGLISRPELINKPVGVSHSSGKNSGSDIASCNYIARSFGVRNGMLIAHAKKMCPNLIVIPYEFENYEKVTNVLYNVLINNSDNIQAVSCDEAYIEIWLPKTGTEEIDILEKAKNIRAEIKQKTQCNSSIGISTNILLARLATKKAKPDGEFYISPIAPESFIKQFNVSDLPGVGWSIEKK